MAMAMSTRDVGVQVVTNIPGVASVGRLGSGQQGVQETRGF